MRKKLFDIINGKFIIEKTNQENIRFVMFLFFLAVIMIFSSHSVDIKIYKLNDLSKNGIISIITYHSAEDRLVKRFFKNGCFDDEPVKDQFGNSLNPFKLKFQFLKPSELELKLNTRSRSAKLRSAMKI